VWVCTATVGNSSITQGGSIKAIGGDLFTYSIRFESRQKCYCLAVLYGAKVSASVCPTFLQRRHKKEAVLGILGSSVQNILEVIKHKSTTLNFYEQSLLVFYHTAKSGQSTPLPALASQHTICRLYLNVCIQIANKLVNKKKVTLEVLC
jgi:hypothetical protein